MEVRLRLQGKTNPFLMTTDCYGLTSGDLPLLPVVVMSLLEPIHLERNPVSTLLHCHKVLNTLV